MTENTVQPEIQAPRKRLSTRSKVMIGCLLIALVIFIIWWGIPAGAYAINWVHWKRSGVSDYTVTSEVSDNTFDMVFGKQQATVHDGVVTATSPYTSYPIT